MNYSVCGSGHIQTHPIYDQACFYDTEDNIYLFLEFIFACLEQS